MSTTTLLLIILTLILLLLFGFRLRIFCSWGGPADISRGATLSEVETEPSALERGEGSGSGRWREVKGGRVGEGDGRGK